MEGEERKGCIQRSDGGRSRVGGDSRSCQRKCEQLDDFEGIVEGLTGSDRVGGRAEDGRGCGSDG
jgi:hypothetical protein